MADDRPCVVIRVRFPAKPLDKEKPRPFQTKLIIETVHESGDRWLDAEKISSQTAVWLTFFQRPAIKSWLTVVADYTRSVSSKEKVSHRGWRPEKKYTSSSVTRTGGKSLVDDRCPKLISIGHE